MATATTERIALTPLHSYSELLTDICDFANLNGFERKQLLGSLDKGSFNWKNMLQSLTRKQLKNYLNFRTGVEKTFTSYSKCDLIDQLVNTLMVKNAISVKNVAVAPKSSLTQCLLNVTRRLRKAKHPTRLSTSSTMSASPQDLVEICKNAACRAKMSAKDPFCKRCSCCLCRKFDDNKDPSLWIICDQDSACEKGGCGQSCHLECALAQGVAGVLKVGYAEVDGGYWCPSCGSISELLGCWKKQVVAAKDARRIDVLYHRLSLALRLLQGTSTYKEIHLPVQVALQILEEEIGPCSKGSSSFVRGIVSRLSVAKNIQENIETALKNLEVLHSIPLEKSFWKKPELLLQDIVKIHFYEVSSAFATVMVEVTDKLLVEQIVEQELWHRKVNQEFGNKPTYSVKHSASIECLLSDLDAGTEYVVRVVTSLKNGMKVENITSFLPKDSKPRNGPGAAGTGTAKACTTTNLLDRAFYELDNTGNTFKVRDIGKIFQKGGSASAERSTEIKLQDRPLETLGFVDSLITFGTAATEPADCKISEERITALNEDADNLNLERINMQKSLKGSNGLGFRPCSNMRRSKLPLDVLLHHCPTHCDTQFDLNKTPEDTHLSRLTWDLMADKNPYANGVCSFVYVQEDHPIEHGNSTSLIVHPHANKIKVTSEVNMRKRHASAQPQLPHKLDYICQQELSVPQNCERLDFEYCVTVVRWLEDEGQVGALFRKRFLSWLGVRATDQQKRVVDAYIKVMISDPESLAEQLMHTFDEIISISKQKAEE